MLSELAASSGTYFIIGLKYNSCLKYASLYLANLNAGTAIRLCGEGPSVLTEADVSGYYKYDSAGKQWKLLHNYGFTPTTDAVALAPRRRSHAPPTPPLASHALPPPTPPQQQQQQQQQQQSTTVEVATSTEQSGSGGLS